MFIFTFLKIRIKQFFRILKATGILRLIFLLFLTFFLLIFLYKQIEKKSLSPYVSTFYAFFIAMIHLSRKDKHFLECLYEKYFLVYIFEYFLISLPLLIFNFIHQRFFEIFFFAIFLVIISFLRKTFQKENRNSFIINLIPKESFEWKAGVRKNFFGIIFLYLGAIFGSFFIGAFFIFLFFSLGIIFSFYQICEPRNILEINNFTPIRFLKRKIFITLKLFSIFCFLPSILFFIFHSKFFHLGIFGIVISYIILIYNVLQKYAFYFPNENLSANSVLNGIVLLSFFIPFLVPLTFFLIIRNFFKAKKRLEFYFSINNHSFA